MSKTDIISSCALCKAIESSNSETHPLYNSLLYESNYFVVMPCIGPILEGHILIISKKHYQNLATMPKEEIVDFKELAIKLEAKTKRRYKNILIAEHGAFQGHKGGACVIHTHLHWIPENSRNWDMLDGDFEKTDICQFENLDRINFPYLLLMNTKFDLKIYKAYNTCSQMIRKAICQIEGRTDYRWQENESLGVVKETINNWKNMNE